MGKIRDKIGKVLCFFGHRYSPFELGGLAFQIDVDMSKAVKMSEKIFCVRCKKPFWSNKSKVLEK